MDSDLRGHIGGCCSGGCGNFPANSHDLDDYDCCNLSDRFHLNSGNSGNGCNPLQQVLLTPSGEEANDECATTKKFKKENEILSFCILNVSMYLTKLLHIHSDVLLQLTTIVWNMVRQTRIYSKLWGYSI